MNALDVMLGTPPGTHRAELSGAGAIPRAPQLASTGSPADLLRRRPDLIVAERRLVAANARIGMAISEYYPTFSSAPCSAAPPLKVATCSAAAPHNRPASSGCAGDCSTLPVSTRRSIRPRASKLKRLRLIVSRFYAPAKTSKTLFRRWSIARLRQPPSRPAKPP